LNNLKLRLGWGLTGNQNIPSQTAWYAVYNPTTTTYGTGLYPGNTPNSDITWESTVQTNIGLAYWHLASLWGNVILTTDPTPLVQNPVVNAKQINGQLSRFVYD